MGRRRHIQPNEPACAGGNRADVVGGQRDVVRAAVRGIPAAWQHFRATCAGDAERQRVQKLAGGEGVRAPRGIWGSVVSLDEDRSGRRGAGADGSEGGVREEAQPSRKPARCREGWKPGLAKPRLAGAGCTVREPGPDRGSPVPHLDRTGVAGSGGRRLRRRESPQAVDACGSSRLRGRPSGRQGARDRRLGLGDG